MTGPTRQEQVINVVRQWRTRLLQIDRRNPLLHCANGSRPSEKRGRRTVTLTGVTPDELLESLAEPGTRLAFTYAERARARGGWAAADAAAAAQETPEPRVIVRPGDLHTDLDSQPLDLQKRLVALSRRDREWQQEQGLNVLFVALGFLSWVDRNGDSARSPIVLVPCELTRESPRDPFVLSCEEADDPVVNSTLCYCLKTGAGVEIPEFGEASISQHLADVAGLVAPHEGWSVETSIALGIFTFSKLPMVEDLDRIASAGVGHPLVRRLAGDDDAPVAAPLGATSMIPKDDADLQGGGLDDLLEVRDQYAVLDADFSQVRAIELARSGANMVIHGPPGTGKSQTIANIIATLLAQGRKVLFVSEKTAALDVVKRRLAEVGLGGFCLDLHSNRGRKASVYQQLREALDPPRPPPSRFPYERLVARRDELNAIVRALHQPRPPLGLSVFAVHGRVAGMSDVPRLNVTVRDVPTLDADRLLRIEDAARRIARRATEFRDHHSSPWRSLGPLLPSPRLADTVRDDLARIRAAVDSITGAANGAARACGVDAPPTLPEAERLLRLLAHLGRAPGVVPARWLLPGGLEPAADRAKSLRQEATERRGFLDTLAASVAGGTPGDRSAAWLQITRDVAAGGPRWERIAGADWSATLVTDPACCSDKWRQVAKALDSLAEASIQLQTLLGVDAPARSRCAADAAVTLTKRVVDAGPIPATWSSAGAVHDVLKAAQAARRLWDDLERMERALGETFELGLVDQVDHDMLVRYRIDYRWIWRWLMPTYRRDRRVLRGFLKRPGSLSRDTAAAAIDRALSIRRLRLQWAETVPRVQRLLGDRFAEGATDWSGIESALDAVAAIYREFPARVTTLHSILMDPARIAQVKEAADGVTKCASAADELWPGAARREEEEIPVISSQARAFAESVDRVGNVLDEVGPFLKRPTDLKGLADFLEVAARLHEIEVRAEAESASRAGEFGAFFAGWSTDLDALDRAFDWTRDILAQVGCPPPPGLAQMVTQPLPSAAFAAAESDLSEALGQFRDACLAASRRFPEAADPWRLWGATPLDAIRKWCEDLSARADQAGDWVEYSSAASALDDVIGAPVTAALRAVTDDAGLVPDTVLRHLFLSWLEHVYRSAPDLQFAPKDVASVAREFRELDAQLPRAARETVAERCRAALDGISNSRDLGEIGRLNYELSKKKRQMPVRQLVRSIPNLLQKMKPCFMTSPLAVSQYLPRGVTESDTLFFDTVIFDEASQVFPEDAVPAIARARQCIVVGDEKQLPPTDFFLRNSAEDGDDSDDEDQSGENVDNRLQGVESILDVLVGMRGSVVDEVSLKVHYRSRHETLIRFSNHYFYDDRLLTFPSARAAQPGLGVQSVYLPNGRYEAGGSRPNRVEAEKVVNMVFELMEARPLDESLGVVALSRAQADLIQELIDLRRPSERQFDERFAEAAREPFFVKNLENVQGDERDHIILSMGYGPTTASGKVVNNFGPVIREGGHRRVNVAVSRARRSMTVVHSLRPEDIHSDKEGARLLRRYLEFIRHGEASIEGAAHATATGEAESPFEDAVGRALTQRGYRIQRQVGCAKYSIDIAVLSEEGDGFDLGIECDGATYHRSPAARDRDRLRQEILERLGWRIHRVWSTAWLRNPRGEVDAIERAIRDARAMPRETAPREVRFSEANARAATAATFATPVMAGAVSGASAAEPPPFRPYVEADLGRFPAGDDLLQNDAACIAELVAFVVSVEEPVHVDVVVERVRRHYGLQRAGNRVRDAVEAAVREAIRRETVRWLPSVAVAGEPREFLATKGNRGIEPRGPFPDGRKRNIDHLCDEEIEAGVVRVVREMVGGAREEVITATARAFGYARTGESVEARVSAAVDRLLATNRLVLRLGSLVARD
ncbi:MAG: DUF3320 domain-containing protein [Planctomycetes bacterium]|nr:DUF3320 domain-containing protein [Planctomycetota bacterium]